MKKFSIPFIMIITLALAGCYYDNEEALYPEYGSSCDTLNITFTGPVYSVLNNNCLSCHSDANAAFGGGIRLQKYADVVSNSQKIIPAVDGSGPKPMPPNGKLNTCGITQLKIWIRNGMPQN